MRKAFVRSGAITAASPPSLLQISKEEVTANSPSGRKMVGRTAEALNKLREAARKEGLENGYKSGFQAGRMEGLASIEAEYRAAVDSFKSLLQDKADQVAFAAQQWTLEAEQSLAELAVEIAARVVAQELKVNTEVIGSIAREVVQEFAHATSVRIRLNPFDAPALATMKEELLSISPQLRNIEIVEDPSILGGCVVESDGGVLESTIETRLKCVLASLREAA